MGGSPQALAPPSPVDASPPSRGGAAPSTVDDQASHALHLATVDPSRATRLARTAERAALFRDDWSAVSVARRAAGVAALQLRRHTVAVGRLHQAVAAARHAGEERLLGQAQMSLASALVLRGSPQAGLTAIDEALSHLSGPLAARARSQRATIAAELGHVDDALADLRLAVPVLRQAGDREWEARALSNRSLLLSRRRQFAAAEADLLRARALCESDGLVLQGGLVEQNLGCLLADRGDVPAALHHLDEAARRYAELNLQVGSLALDRARILLSVRLLTEARAAAEEAVRTFAAQHRRIHLPEARLVLSTIALLQGDADTATTAAAGAARTFARQGRREWHALAHYAVLQAQSAAVDPGADGGGSPSWVGRTTGPRLSDRLVAAAAELERVGWDVPALEARVQAGTLALREGRPRTARTQLALAARARRSGPVDVRSRAWLGEALLREAEGNRRGAKAALRAGLRVLADHRATLGATELRAHVSVHRGALARTGLRMALADGDAWAAHWWSERNRASASPPRPVRPPADPVLAGYLEDLRTTMTELDEARGTGAVTTALLARQVRLEQVIRDHCRHLGTAHGPGDTAHPVRDAVVEAVGDDALVEYLDLDGQLQAVTVVDGRATLHHLGPQDRIRHWVRHLPFALHRLTSPATRPAQLTAAQQVLTAGARGLQRILLEPLLPTLGSRPLVVVPTGWLQSVPWSLLPACAGRPVSVAPSVGLWHAASRRRPERPAGTVAVAGPRLAQAAMEARAVAALHPGTALLTGAAATAARVARALDGARIAHVAAHGTVRSDNALFSSLLLADGPYTVYDLERLTRTPHHVVLAACSTALSQVTAGEEVLGLAAALLTRETASLVAPVVPVPDAETVALMTTYHRLLRTGCTPAGALAEAQQQHRGDGVRAAAGAAAFVCLGAGHVS